MPPRAWVESERHAAITELGHARMLTERGAPSRGARTARGRTGARREPHRESRGGHAALLALERDALVTLTKPLKGSASAFRSVRVA